MFRLPYFDSTVLGTIFDRSVITTFWSCVQSDLFPIWQDTWLGQARSAFSMCSGVGTAEAARAVLQSTINSDPDTRHGPVRMDIETVALWDPCREMLRIIDLKPIHRERESEREREREMERETERGERERGRDRERGFCSGAELSSILF